MEHAQPGLQPLVACQECDALHRPVALQPRDSALCVRCGAVLYSRVPGAPDRTLAYVLAAAIVFVVANVFPLVAIDAQGTRTSATLFGTVRALHESGMTSVAALVFVTTMLMPALELGAMTYMLLPLEFGRVPPGLAAMYRLVQAARPWGMVEVFMLGLLVSLVKLGHVAAVVPGIALWSFGVLMLLFAATDASFDARALWARVEESRS